jgi:hypothetical protein
MIGGAACRDATRFRKTILRIPSAFCPIIAMEMSLFSYQTDFYSIAIRPWCLLMQKIPSLPVLTVG